MTVAKVGVGVLVRRGYRTSEHALDRLLGEALRVLELLDGDGARTGHIAVDDGRAHIPRAVALHPASLGEGKALQLHAKVLHPA